MGTRAISHPAFWNEFINSTAISDADDRFFGAMRFTLDSPGDDGAELVLTGAKTATTVLRADHEGEMPEIGQLAIVEDDSGQPVAVVQLSDVTTEKFADIDDSFARAFGEWGGSLKSWRRQCRALYAPRCRSIGRPFSEETEIVCIRFHVVHDPAGTAQASRRSMTRRRA